MKILRILCIAVLVLVFCGCEKRPIFSKKISIDGQWTYDNVLKFPFTIEDTEQNHDLIFRLSYGRDFGYQNVYVKIITTYPDGHADEDILSLNLTNGSGLFLGDCGSKQCEIDLLLQERFKFKDKGAYEISIIQNGRKESLAGIYGGELKLYTIEE